MTRPFLTALIFLVMISCNKEDPAPEIPVVPVNFVIDPNSTQYLNLNHPGGWEYLTGGYRGILIYRSTINEFMAFERACPFDFDAEDARIEVDTSGITCYCPSCLSKFILLDGTPYEGPSRYPLKQYQAVYNGTYLYISN